MSELRHTIGQRLLAAIDLAIDLATLGEYGLEVAPAGGPGCEQTRAIAPGWEAFAAERRGGCDVSPASYADGRRRKAGRPTRGPRPAAGRT